MENVYSRFQILKCPSILEYFWYSSTFFFLQLSGIRLYSTLRNTLFTLLVQTTCTTYTHIFLINQVKNNKIQKNIIDHTQCTNLRENIKLWLMWRKFPNIVEWLFEKENYYKNCVLQQSKIMTQWWCDNEKGVSPKLKPWGVHLEA